MNKKQIAAIQKSLSKKRQQQAVDYLVRHRLVLDFILSDYKNVYNYIKFTTQVGFYVDIDKHFRVSHNLNLVSLEPIEYTKNCDYDTILSRDIVLEMSDEQKKKIVFLIEFGGINNV